jgi:ribosomal protein S18 acetylase RimI-like enzyme
MGVAKSGLLTADVQAIARLKAAGTTLIKPESDVLYVSRIGTLVAARGLGVGSLMLEAAECEGRERGCSRLALEVAPESAAAVRLYQRHGLKPAGGRIASDPATGRRLEYLHMIKPIRG